MGSPIGSLLAHVSVLASTGVSPSSGLQLPPFHRHPGILVGVPPRESLSVGLHLENLWLSCPYFQVQDPFPPNYFFLGHWFRVLLALLQGWGFCLLGVCPSGVEGIL